MKLIKTFLFSIIILSCTYSYAQISGVSMDKLGSYHCNVQPHLNIQFEPGFSYTKSNKYWDNNSELKTSYQTMDSISTSSYMCFRFTMGLFNKAEIGLNISPDLSRSRWALKYQIHKTNKVGFAMIGGATIPLGNGVVDKTIIDPSNLTSAGIGAVSSYQFTDKFSGDITAQYSHYITHSENNEVGGIFINSDFGYYIFNNSVQVMAGLGYQNIMNDITNQELLYVNTGFALCSPKNYDIAFVVPFSIYGKNESQYVGLEFYFTLYFK